MVRAHTQLASIDLNSTPTIQVIGLGRVTAGALRVHEVLRRSSAEQLLGAAARPPSPAGTSTAVRARCNERRMSSPTQARQRRSTPPEPGHRVYGSPPEPSGGAPASSWREAS